MNELKYYFSIFLRRLHYFLIVSVVATAASVIAAFTLPPAYESQTRILIEGPQIPTELAASTVSVGLREQLEIIEQRLMTRANMLDVARRQNVFEGIGAMSADAIVSAMRSRTTLRRGGSSRAPSPVLTIIFEARSPGIAAGVLNEYLTLIENQNAEFRTARAGNTLEFFEQEVERLGRDLDEQSARILEFKTRNAEALPDSLQVRLDQQGALREQSRQIDREIQLLILQKDRLIQVFEVTGRAGNGQPLSRDERRLQDLQTQLDEALSIYSPENPRVKMLEARIAQIEERMASASAEAADPETSEQEARPGATMLDLELSEIDARVSILQERKGEIQTLLAAQSEAISRIPANSVALDELMRVYNNIEGQYNLAVDRLARASTGQRIESLSRGQRISVIEPPAAPSQPTKPNRVFIAGGGTAAGIAAGLGLVLLIELLNRTARRPEDIINRIGVRPLSSLPYIQSRSEVVRRRLAKIFVYLIIIVGMPIAVYAVHLYYLPLDLLADRTMNAIGVRW
ncbi:GumC family protein [Aestuariivita boseongensis]|uniref:GumC family protein n=1 Tax=Aestuariivita boseongensis TaxID=1470562 RepID=UPI0006836715|nr:Wzz/FepE/Etk N-terminal domain-containing protein [Aestuariivita boseongensis]